MEIVVAMVTFNVNLIDLWHSDVLGLKHFEVNGDISIPNKYHFWYFYYFHSF